MNAYDILRKPRITERAYHLQSKLNTYVFEVHPDANKPEIKKAVESIFKVRVKKVTTQNYDGKQRRRGRIMGRESAWKKAFVVVHEDDAIEGV